MTDSLPPNSSTDPVPGHLPIPPGFYQPAASDRSYLVAWLLSLFLGTFGIDRFYLGRVGTGILKLVTLGGFGIWTAVDWICITLGVTRDKHGRTLDGYSTYRKKVQSVSLMVFIVCLAVGLWQGTHNDPRIDSASTQRKSITSDLAEEKLELPRLIFDYPKSWKITSEGLSRTDDGHTGQDFFLKAPDGFVLGFQAEDDSWFSNDAGAIHNTKVIAEVLSGNSVGSGVVTSNGDADKPYSAITVARGVLKAGDSINTANEDLPTNPSVKNLYISINGGYNDMGFSTLAEFNNQVSVRQAVLILRSMKYY